MSAYVNIFSDLLLTEEEFRHYLRMNVTSYYCSYTFLFIEYLHITSTNTSTSYIDDYYITYWILKFTIVDAFLQVTFSLLRN